MKLKKVLKPKKIEVKVVEPEKKERKPRGSNKLGSNEYKPMFEPIRIGSREYASFKNEDSKVNDYLEFSVKRFDDDEARAMVFITMYRESEAYTGYLKGKTIHFPIDKIQDVIDSLKDCMDKCEENHIEW